MYVHDTVKPRKELKKRQRLAHVFAIHPLDSETRINLDLNLSKYRTPSEMAPITTANSAIAIESSCSRVSNVVFEGESMNNSAVSGADTLISFEPCAIASMQIETDRGNSKSLSMRCSARFWSHEVCSSGFML
jgi:hypothetical protein